MSRCAANDVIESAVVLVSDPVSSDGFFASVPQCAMAHHAMPATVDGVDTPNSQSLESG